MARSKADCRKSTGGKAPRKQLAVTRVRQDGHTQLRFRKVKSLNSKNNFFPPRAEENNATRALVGRRISIYWDGDRVFFPAKVLDYRDSDGKHVVKYDNDADGDVYDELLRGQKWRIWRGTDAEFDAFNEEGALLQPVDDMAQPKEDPPAPRGLVAAGRKSSASTSSSSSSSASSPRPPLEEALVAEPKHGGRAASSRVLPSSSASSKKDDAKAQPKNEFEEEDEDEEEEEEDEEE